MCLLEVVEVVARVGVAVGVGGGGLAVLVVVRLGGVLTVVLDGEGLKRPHRDNTAEMRDGWRVSRALAEGESGSSWNERCDRCSDLLFFRHGN